MEFNFKGFTVNCFELEGDAWFFANDIAKILGYTDRDQAVRKHTFESDRKRLNFKASVDLTESNIRSLWKKNDYSDKTLINESGVYCMIFGSKLPAAEEFKKWVTREVLPSIRKYGGYVLGQENLPSDKAEELEEELKRLSEQVRILTGQNDKFKSRWHELVSEKNQLKDIIRNLKEKNKKLNLNIKLLNEDANDNQKILEKVLDDYNNLLRKINPVKKEVKPQVDTGLTYKVDRDGRVIF